MNFKLLSTEITKKGLKPMRFFIREGTSDQKALDETIRKNTYLKKGVEVLPGETWLDLGANIGGFSVLAWTRGARVFTVECEDECLAMAERNVRLNGFPFQGAKAAVSLRPGEKTFYVFNPNRPKAQRRHSLTKPLKDFRETKVRGVTLGSLVRAHKPQGAKINIEGEEIKIMLEDPEQFRGLRKVAMEYSFDKDKTIKTYEQCKKNMSRWFNVFEMRKIKPGMETFDFYPPNQFLYLIAK